MRDDNEGVMERGWKSFMRVTKYCIKGGVYTLLNMILVNRENPTLNGVDYHNVVRTDCSRLPCFTGQAVLPAFTLNNCRIKRKHGRNLTEMCGACRRSSQRSSLWRRDCIQQVRSSKEPKCSLQPLQSPPPPLIQLPIPFSSLYVLATLLFTISFSITLPSTPAHIKSFLPFKFPCPSFICITCLMFAPSFCLLIFFLKLHQQYLLNSANNTNSISWKCKYRQQYQMNSANNANSTCWTVQIMPKVPAEQCK